jgi:hypothetical protein
MFAEPTINDFYDLVRRHLLKVRKEAREAGPLGAALLIAGTSVALAQDTGSPPPGIFPPHYFATLLSAFFGTLIGAFVTSRVQTKKAVVEELRATGAAIHLCYIICNTAIALKKQHAGPIRERYEKARADYLKALESAASSTRPDRIVYRFLADFQTLTPPRMPGHLLERQVFEKVGIRGRGLAAALETVNAVEALSKAIDYRNSCIADVYKMSPRPPEAELAKMYFGVRTELGTIDEKFRTSVEALTLATDDCIFFALQAAKDLHQYGVAFRRKNLRRLRLFLPSLPEADMSPAAQFLPKATEYEGWMKGFKETRPWYKRMARKIGSWRPWATQAK